MENLLCEKSCGLCLATFTAGFVCAFDSLHAAPHQFAQLSSDLNGLMQEFITWSRTHSEAKLRVHSVARNDSSSYVRTHRIAKS